MSDHLATITLPGPVTDDSVQVTIGPRRGRRAAVPPTPRPEHGYGGPPQSCEQAPDVRDESGMQVLPCGNRSTVYLVTKRGCDIVGALALLVLLSPILAATFLVLLITTRGKPLFAQQRVGLCGRPFRLYKFRTMCNGAADMQHLIENQHEGPIFKNISDPRVTRLGRFLRSFSIDETPQLFNVLQGHMSLVGPRPPLAEEVRDYEPWQRNRLGVKPGLTCLWQVSGRSEIGFEEWMRMDIWYLEHQGLITDLSLLLRTPFTVLSRRGAW